MEALIWLASGMLAGWLAGRLMKGRDYGLSGNLILGILGGLVGGWVFEKLGLGKPTDHLRHAIVSLFGAMLVLGVARWLKPVAHETRKVVGDVGQVADLEDQIHKLGEFERNTFARLLGHTARFQHPYDLFEEQMTFGERTADKVAKFGGSWTFIGLFLLFMVIWMISNSVTKKHFDPFPFILLNLVLSCLAALQAPVIMMSQNRQGAKDRKMIQHDYETNMRAELDIQKLHQRFDELRERDWAALVEMQQRQIELLERMVRDLCPPRREGGESV